ncbi:hypothetical protein RKE29_20325, partial [Streptomyces sp. B1866]
MRTFHPASASGATFTSSSTTGSTVYPASATTRDSRSPVMSATTRVYANSSRAVATPQPYTPTATASSTTGHR